MDYALLTAWRHLRARRRGGGATSVVAVIAVLGIAFGVAALSAVLAVTSGFEAAFREKLLGMDAHLLLLRPVGFADHREVLARVRATPGVAAAAPFVANPMMITHGDRIASAMVKGVDPERVGQVVDLPAYLVGRDHGQLRALRAPDARPPAFAREPLAQPGDPATLDAYLALARERVAHAGGGDEAPWLDTHPPLDAPAAAAHPGPAAAAPLPAGPTPAYATPPDDPASDPAELLAREAREEAERSARARAGALPGVILGRTLAASLAVAPGDTVRLVSPLAGSDAVIARQGGEAPRVMDFRVVGTFDAGFDQFDAHLAYVDLWEAQRIVEQEGDVVTGLEVRVRDPSRAAAIGRRIERELGGRPYLALDWEALHRNVFTALGLQKLALSIVIAIIIVVAAFNVVATLVMAVLDKRREIAILKAMGADERGVMKIFLLQGLAVGALGTALGLLLGAGVCAALLRWPVTLDPSVYLIRQVPVRPSALEFALTALIALAISLASALAPAAWAARLAPVDGLRGE